MKDKIVKTAAGVTTSTKRVVSNVEQLVQAVALLVTAGFSYFALSRVSVSQPVKVGVTVALVVIGLRGSLELFRFLDKK